MDAMERLKVGQTVLILFGVRSEEAREAVSRALDEVSGVREVQVNMYRAEAVIVHNGRCSPRDLVAALSAAGVHWQPVQPLPPTTPPKNERWTL